MPVGSKEPVICIRSNPIKYELRNQQVLTNLLSLEYRMIFAVATTSSVLIYDTQNWYPIALFQSIHYAEITDLSWSYDGSYLLISSKDGFCTLVNFPKEILGKPYFINTNQNNDK